MSKGSGAAFVLHQWDWSETSLILEVFSRDQGRVAAVAKGAKRPYSQLRSVLLPFQRLQVAFTRPKGEEGSEILTLRSAEYTGPGLPLPPAQLFAGFYLNELLMKLLARQDPHPRLFDLYAETLQALALADDEAPLRAFELMLLRETGVLPELDHLTQTQAAVQPLQALVLRAEAGLGTGTGDLAPVAGSHWLALQAALSADDRGQLQQACTPVLPALRAQLRQLLHYHLGSPHLRSRAAMIEVRRLLDPSTSPLPPR